MGGAPTPLAKANISKAIHRCPKVCTPYFLLNRGRGLQNLQIWGPSENVFENR